MLLVFTIFTCICWVWDCNCFPFTPVIETFKVSNFSGSIPMDLTVLKFNKLHWAPLSAIKHWVVVGLEFLFRLVGSIFVICTDMNGWEALLDSNHFPFAWSKTEVSTDRSVVEGRTLSALTCMSLVTGPSKMSIFSSSFIM